LKRTLTISRHGRVAVLVLTMAVIFALPLRVLADVQSDGTGPLDRQLVAAGKASDLEAVKNLIIEGANVNAIDDGYTALDGAAAYGNFTLCSYLLSRGADPNLTGAGRPLPLTLAVESKNVEVIKLLLGAGAHIDATSTEGESALMRAVVNDSPILVHFLLSRGADVNATNSLGQTPLFVAAYFGYGSIIRQLAAADAKLDAATTDFYTPLNIAAERGQAAAVRTLISVGAPVNYVPKHGDCALSAGIRSGDFETFRVLLVGGAEVNGADDYGNTPLIVAASLATSPKRVEMLKALVNHGASIYAANVNGQTALMAAAASDAAPAVAYLIDHKAPVSTIDSFNETALMYAAGARKSSITVLRHPISSGATDPDGATPQAQRDTMAVLLPKTHDATETGTALFIACSNGSTGAVQALLSSGVSPNIVTDEIWYPLLSPISRMQDPVDRKFTGMTPMMFAASHNYPDIIHLLAANKGNVAATDAAGRTALIHAAATGSLSAVRELVRLGADVNTRDQNGRTALYAVVESGAVGSLLKLTQGQATEAARRAANQTDAAIVATLLAAHADPKVPNADGNTPAKEASSLKRTEIANALAHGSMD